MSSERPILQCPLYVCLLTLHSSVIAPLRFDPRNLLIAYVELYGGG